MNTLPLVSRCQKFQERFFAHLCQTRDLSARLRLYTTGLREFQRQILPALQALALKDDDASRTYGQGQRAAATLLHALLDPYLRFCLDFDEGVILLDEMISSCSDPVLKRRLLSASQQLMKNCKKAEASGPDSDSGAAKSRSFRERNESQFFMGISLFLLLLLSGAVFVSSLRPHPPRPVATKSLLAASLGAALPSPVVAAHPLSLEAPHLSVAPLPPVPSPSPLLRHDATGIYKFTDAQGGVHFVDQFDKVPVEARTAAIFSGAGGGERSSINVEIDGNQVLVPVTLRHGERNVTALLLLDTGCTVTTITEELANRLQIDSRTTRLAMARVADGRSIATRHTRIDQLMVGDRSQTSAEVSIMPYSGVAERYDGLLGMSFLRQHRYQVDYENGLIRWQ